MKLPKEIAAIFEEFQKKLEGTGAKVKMVQIQDGMAYGEVSSEVEEPTPKMGKLLGFSPGEDPVERKRNMEALNKYGVAVPEKDNDHSRAYRFTDEGIIAKRNAIFELGTKAYPSIDKGPFGLADKIQQILDISSGDIEKIKGAACALFMESEGLHGYAANALMEAHGHDEDEILKFAPKKKEVWN
jgi:hypothetical protein